MDINLQKQNLEQLEEQAIIVIRQLAGTGIIPKIQYHNKELKIGINVTRKDPEELILLVKQNKQLLLDYMLAKLEQLKQEQQHLEQLFNNGKSNTKEYSSYTNSDLAIRHIYKFNTCINYPSMCSGYFGCYGCTDWISRQEELINYVQ